MHRLAPLALISALLLPATVSADAVPMAPDTCPEGTVGGSDHNCAYCTAQTCSTDADCAATEQCASRQLCRDSASCFNMGGSWTVADTRQCTDVCACEAVSVCVPESSSTTSGCACRAAPGRAGGLGALGAFGVLLLARQRRLVTRCQQRSANSR